MKETTIFHQKYKQLILLPTLKVQKEVVSKIIKQRTKKIMIELTHLTYIKKASSRLHGRA